ncbi:MAG: hypothetical protein GY874_21295 [Desulfobacteraceae bacterium]|nr:hypothetical protein [Desulfobacteraceae bacterium]
MSVYPLSWFDNYAQSSAITSIFAAFKTLMILEAIKNKVSGKILQILHELPATMFHMEAVSCFTEGGNPPSPHFGRF